MITLFRNFAKSKWAVGLFALIILSFLIVGAQSDVFSNLGPKHVIDAGSRSVDSARFRSDFERVRNNLQEQAGRPVTFDDMVKENIHTQYLDSQTQRLGFLSWAYSAGIRPGKELVLKEIRQIPAFFNQITGKFDEDLYKQALAAQNLTPEMLEQDLRDQYVQSQFGTAIFAGARLPRIYGAVLAGQALETRDGRWFNLTPAMVGTAPAPTDAQLTAFINENAAQLRRPEFRMISIVLFNPGPNAQLAPVSDERIRERYEFRKDALSQPEKRSFVTVTVPTKEAADKISADLRAGKASNEVAAANRVQPSTYNDTPQAALGDPAVGAAVFALAANQISDPIKSRLGYTVAKVSAISPAAPATLESVRAALIEELRADDVKGATYAKVEQYEKARQDGKTLADAAKAVGARLVQLPPFTAEGRLPDGQPLNAPTQIFESAFALSKGGESDIIEAGEGQYFAVRVDDIRPAALPTLAEVRGPLAQQWTQRENARRLTNKAEELAQRIRGGEDIAKVAASINAAVQTRANVMQSREVQADLGEAVLRGLFGQAKGQVFTGPGEAGVVVGIVDAIKAANPAQAGSLVEQVRPRLTQEVTNAMVQQSFTAAATRLKAKNDPAAALAAIGVETPTATAAPAPAPAKK